MHMIFLRQINFIQYILKFQQLSTKHFKSIIIIIHKLKFLIKLILAP